MISYAQNGEDVLLDRLFPRDMKGFYVDVGANDPVQNSVTKHFYDLGWRGINIEPAEEPFRLLCQYRQRDVNLNIGISDAAGTLTLHQSPVGTGDSTFSAEGAARLREEGTAVSERTVPVITLTELFEDHIDGDIDFLTIDVESHEAQVLRGGDWKRWRPRVVVVEATEPRTSIPSHEEWEPTLLDADYLFASFDGLNRYYVRAEDSDLVARLQTPVNVFDQFDPYGYIKPLEDLRRDLEASNRNLVAARVANDTLWHEYHDLLADYHNLEPDLSMLQAEFERLQRGLANTRAHQEQVKAAVEAAEARYGPLSAALAEATARSDEALALFEAINPAALGVARRLTRLAGSFPRTAGIVTRAARVLLARKRAISQAASA